MSAIVKHGFEIEITVTAVMRVPREAYDPGVTPEGVAQIEKDQFELEALVDNITGVHVNARNTSWAETDE